MKIQGEISATRGLIIEAFGRLMGIYGMNETIGRIYGLLYFADKEMSLDEMADKLEVSKATISINIRILVALKMVQKVWKRGSRKDFYIAERDFEKIYQEILRSKVQNELVIIKDAINQAVDRYKKIIEEEKGEIKEVASSDLERVMNLASWIRVGESWIKFMMDTDFNEGPPEEPEEIKVEWEDEE